MECSIAISDWPIYLTTCLYELQQTGVLCDAGLECKDGVAFVHKLILLACGSPYLQQQISKGNNTNSRCYVNLNDFTLKSVCCLVQALYTGRLRIFHDHITDFISLCRFLGLEKIQSTVQEFVDKEEHMGMDLQNTSKHGMIQIHLSKDFLKADKISSEKLQANVETMVDSTSDIKNQEEQEETEKNDNKITILERAGCSSRNKISPQDKSNREQCSSATDSNVFKMLQLANNLSTDQRNRSNSSLLNRKRQYGNDSLDTTMEDYLSNDRKRQYGVSDTNTSGELMSSEQNEDIKPVIINCTCKICKKSILIDIRAINIDNVEDMTCKDCENNSEDMEEKKNEQQKNECSTEKMVKMEKSNEIESTEGPVMYLEEKHAEHQYNSCQLKTQVKSNLSRHIRVCLGGCNNEGACNLTIINKQKQKVKDKICSTCGKAFTSRYGLSLHVKATHKKEFRFYCHICDKGLTTLWNYNGHMASHDKDLKEKCVNCGSTFNYKQSLLHHQKTCGRKKVLDNKVECFTCRIEFTSKDGLREHNYVVHAGRMLPCKICGKNYKWRSSLAKHMRQCAQNSQNTDEK